MNTGKLPPEILTRLLSRAHSDSSVIIGPAYGEDAAAVRFGGKVLIAAADPVTFATDRIGYYAVCVNANDIAVLGATPKYFLATILLPEGSTESDAESVFSEIEQSCQAIGVTLIGGHTEITPTVTQTVVSGCMLGEATEDSLIRTGGAAVGDAIVLIGGYAIEGASILAREAASSLQSHGVSEQTISRAAAYVDTPGICIVDSARIAKEIGGVTAMHDPTEGGVATALREVATAAGKGFSIDRDALQPLQECDIICRALRIDPLGLIASGCLILTIDPSRADDLLCECISRDIAASVIGRVVPADRGIRFTDGTDLPTFERDEIARYLDERTP